MMPYYELFWFKKSNSLLHCCIENLTSVCLVLNGSVRDLRHASNTSKIPLLELRGVE